MKIGVITYWTSSNNYGMALQLYALQIYLKELGHDVFLIKFAQKSKIGIISKCKSICLNLIKYILPLKKRLDIEARHQERRLGSINNKLNKQRRFKDFLADNILTNDVFYGTIEELRTNPPQADLYICGSDQIWGRALSNPDTAGYYLNFGDTNIKRISYAASMGGYIPSDADVAVFRSYLDNFDGISLREEFSVDFCKSLGYNEAKTTLDPTLLLPKENYISLCKNSTIDDSKQFLFAYILNIKSQEEMYWCQIKSYITQQQLDFKIVYSSGYIQARELLPEVKSMQATIPEWILCIEKSQAVITTSFHCVVFSIKLHKPFLAIMLNGSHSKGNSRIISLLEKLGLGNRIFEPSIPVDKQMSNPINWAEVDDRLSKLLIYSVEFLNHHLS